LLQQLIPVANLGVLFDTKAKFGHHFFMKIIIFASMLLVGGFLACHDTFEKKPSTTANPAAAAGIEYSGLAIFQRYCVNCHGSDGKLGMSGAKNLAISELSLDSRIQIITNGKNLMTPFKALLNEGEIKAVAEYSLTLKAAQ
jgi:mono/diheme cytochrome c family protein